MINMVFIKQIFNLNYKKMKKLSKLNINSEKIIKNEELVTLRGGHDGEGGWCGTCEIHVPEFLMSGAACSYSQAGANITCTTTYKALFGPQAYCTCY